MNRPAAAATLSRDWVSSNCTMAEPMTTASAQAVGTVSDAVVIGSAIVQLLETQSRDNVAAAAGRFIAGIRAALDSLEGVRR